MDSSLLKTANPYSRHIFPLFRILCIRPMLSLYVVLLEALDSC